MKLVICEKPSQAQAISAVLNANTRRDGFLEGDNWLVSWCFGHLVELAPADAYGEQYKRWSRDALPILPERWKYDAAKDKRGQLSVLRELMKRADVDSVVCATDAGREGELIFRLVYDYCKCKKPVWRLWISSMEDSAIREGFERLRPGADYDNLYHAALCRSQADWLVGINATRLFSCLYGTTLNVGRVQSPTLALIVERESAVRTFVSEPFFIPEIDCGDFAACGEKLRDRKTAEAVSSAADGRDAACLSVEKQQKTAAPPRLYDLTTLQREANRLFGFTAQQTLDYTQSLYEKKLCTYPRTDSRFLTADMAADIPELIRMVEAAFPFVGGLALGVAAEQVINDAKMSDHHAVIPTMTMRTADLDALPAGERGILQMLVARLIAAVAPTHSFEAVTAVLECGGHQFTAKGRTVLRDGWKTADDAFRATLKKKPDDDGEESASTLPVIRKGQAFLSVKASVREGKTSPPRRYTEDTLLSAMESAGAEDMPDDAERKGLGTPATRAATIEKLIKSGFVERQKKNLVPTTKGINLIAVLPEEIKSPMLTAEWEQQLKLIERGKLTDTAFMDGIAALTRGLASAHRAPLPEYATLFSSNPNVANRDVCVGTCPRCGSPVTERDKGFFCSNRSCRFALWKSNRFFEAKKKKLDKKIAAAFLSERRVFFSDLYSEKTGKTYAAAVLLEDDGEKTQFKLEFEKGLKNK